MKGDGKLPDTELRQQIRKEERDRLKFFAGRWYDQNDAIAKRYNNLLLKKDGEGKPLYTEEQAKEIVRDAFGLKTLRRINNIIKRSQGSASPGMRAFTEAVMSQRVQQMAEIADEAQEHAFAELEAIEEAEAEGDEWIEIECEDSDKYGTKTKKITIAEAKRRWYERAKDDAREFFTVVRSVLPQTVVQTMVDNRSTVSQMDDSELDKIIEKDKKRGSGFDS